MKTIRMAMSTVGVACLLACGGGAGPEGDEPAEVETLVREFTATPIDAGVHPDAFAYTLVATVLKGENPCVAGNHVVRFERRREDETLFIRAVRAPVERDRVCTQEFNPVFEELTTEVRGFRSDPASVIVEHVGEMGEQRSLW